MKSLKKLLKTFSVHLELKSVIAFTNCFNSSNFSISIEEYFGLVWILLIKSSICFTCEGLISEANSEIFHFRFCNTGFISIISSLSFNAGLIIEYISFCHWIIDSLNSFISVGFTPFLSKSSMILDHWSSIFSCGLTTLQFLTLCKGVKALFKLLILLFASFDTSVTGLFVTADIIGSSHTTPLNSTDHCVILSSTHLETFLKEFNILSFVVAHGIILSAWDITGLVKSFTGILCVKTFSIASFQVSFHKVFETHATHVKSAAAIKAQ